MAKTFTRTATRGSLARAVALAVLTAVGVTLGISVEDLTQQDARAVVSARTSAAQTSDYHTR
jgi:hypothetical protein